MVNFIIGQNSPEDILTESIFLNKRFKIENKVLCFEDWTGKYVFFVKDLVKDDGAFLNSNEFQERFHRETSFLKCYGSISTIKKHLLRNNIVIKNRTPLDANKAYSLVHYAPKGSKVFYNNLINSHSTKGMYKFGKRF